MAHRAPVLATVDLGALVENLAALRALLPSGTAMLAAVKANAYGHGATEVSRHLEATGGAQMLGVATVAEGLELRQGGVGLPILKLSHCFQDELAEAIEANLSLTIVDEDTARAASRAATEGGAAVKVHLKLDSGMGRLGLPLAQGPRLARLVSHLPGLTLEGVFTHLPVSDVVDDGGFTRAELLDFRATVAAIEAEVGSLPLVHAANSGAILNHDMAGFTLARPGIAMYGYYPDATTVRSAPLRQALRLTTRLSFRKWVEPGTSVGYGRTWVAEHGTFIGTVPLGYGDGFSRLNSNRGQMLLNGRRVPVVGRVCMDQTMIDLGSESADEVGDEVVVLGTQGDEHISTEEVAALMGTITYEVTSLVSGRVRRAYVA